MTRTADLGSGTSGGSGSSRRATLHDVADRAGVSVSTVSRFVNGNDYVSAAAADAVAQAMQDLQYAPNAMARSLRTRASMTVGCVVPNMLNHVYAALADGLDDVIATTSRTLLLATSGADGHREAQAIRRLIERSVDGLVVQTTTDRSTSLAELISQAAKPVVLVDREFETEVADDYVLVDHSGVADAAYALRAAGHETALLIAPTPHIRPGREIVVAFRSVYPDGIVLSGALTTSTGERAAARLFESAREDRPTAAIICGIPVVAGVIARLQEYGVQVPRDLSVVAYDDSPVTRIHQPNLATISRDLSSMGTAAAQLLISRLDDPGLPPRTRTITSRFHPTESIAAPSQP